jgi:hypothetical protein
MGRAQIIISGPKAIIKARTDLGGEEYFPMFLYVRLNPNLPLSACG